MKRYALALAFVLLGILMKVQAQINITITDFDSLSCNGLVPILTLEVDTAGTNADSIQWLQDGADLPGEIATTLDIGQFQNGGAFQAEWYDSLGNQIGISAIATITVAEAPEAFIEGELEVCPGGNTTLTAQPAGLDYLWSDGSTGQELIVYSASTFTVTVTEGNGCSDTVSAIVVENQGLEASIDGNDIICGDGEVTLTATPMDAEYLWSTGAVSNSITVSDSGEYRVTVTLMGCTGSDTIVVDDVANPVLSINVQDNSGIQNDSVLCSGDEIVLEASASIGSPPFVYNWNTPTPEASLTVTAAGAYSVTVTDNNGCTDTNTVFIDENALPAPLELDSGSIKKYCQGENAQPLMVNSEGVESGAVVEWRNAENAIIEEPVIPNTENIGIQEFDVLQVDTFGCASEALRVDVEIFPMPGVDTVFINQVISNNGNGEACMGDDVIIEMKGDFDGIGWEDNTFDNPRLIESIITKLDYSFEVIDTNSGKHTCSSTGNGTIEVNPLPEVNLEVPNQNIEVGERFFVLAITDAEINTFTWVYDTIGLLYDEDTRGDTLELEYGVPGDKNVMIKVEDLKMCFGSENKNISIKGIDEPDVTIGPPDPSYPVCQYDTVVYKIEANRSSTNFEFTGVGDIEVGVDPPGAGLWDINNVELGENGASLEFTLELSVLSSEEFDLLVSVTERNTLNPDSNRTGADTERVIVRPDPDLEIMPLQNEACQGDSISIEFRSEFVPDLEFVYQLNGVDQPAVKLNNQILIIKTLAPDSNLTIGVSRYLPPFQGCDFQINPPEVVHVNPLPSGSLTSDANKACLGNEITFRIDSTDSATQIKWSASGGSIGGDENTAILTTTAEGEITVSAALELAGCLDTLRTQVEFVALPAPMIQDVLPSVQVCRNQHDVVYEAVNVEGATFTWTISGGDTLYTNENKVSVNWNKNASEGKIQVEARLDEGCVGSDTVEIVFSQESALDTGELSYLPNAELLLYRGPVADWYRWGMYNGTEDTYLDTSAYARVFKHRDGLPPSSQSGQVREYWVETILGPEPDFDGEYCVTRTWFQRTLPGRMGLVVAEDPKEERTIVVFPNPSSGQIFIDVDDSIGDEYWVTVFDPMGRAITNREFMGKPHQGVFNLDIEPRANGTVYLRIESGTGVVKVLPVILISN